MLQLWQLAYVVLVVSFVKKMRACAISATPLLTSKRQEYVSASSTTSSSGTRI